MRRTLLRPALLTLAAFALSACAEVIIADRTVSINKAVEQANNRLLLLNAIRASQRHPLYFAKVTSVNVSDPLTAGLSFPIPFGGDATNAFKLSPSLSGVKSGLSYTYEPLDDSKFIAAINKQVSLATFRRLLQQGWPSELIFLVLVREISLTRTNLVKIDEAYQAECKAKSNLDGFCIEHKDAEGKKTYHAGIRKDLVPYPKCLTFDQILDLPNKKPIKFVNTPDDIVKDENDEVKLQPCRFLAFQELVRRIRIAGFDYKSTKDVNFVTSEEIVTSNDGTTETRETSNRTSTGAFVTNERTAISKGGTTITQKTSNRVVSSTLSLRVPTPREGDTQAEIDQATLLKADESESGSLALRSPKDMVFYLGQIISAETAPNRSFEPKVALGLNRTKLDVFGVSLGSNDAALVEVSFLDKTYHIPAGSRQSMRTLSLVNQMILLQQSEKEPVGPKNVRIIN